MNEPACRGSSPRMFDSTAPMDHLRARQICATCPMVMACLDDALAISAQYVSHAQRGPDGTWAGLLWRDGRVVDCKRVDTWQYARHKRSA